MNLLATAPMAIYLAVLAVCWADAFVPVVPSETTVLAAGVVTARGDLALPAVIAAAALGATAGDLTGVLLGRHLPRRGSPPGRISRRLTGPRRAVIRLLGRMRGAVWTHPYLMLILARFVPGGRTAVTMTAGRAGLPWRRLTTAIALAGTLWATTVATVGRVAGAAVRERPLLSAASAAVAVLVAVVLVIRSSARDAEPTRRPSR